MNVGTAEEDVTSTSSSAASTATVVSKKEPIPLEIEATFPTLQPMSVSEKRLGRDRLVVYAYISACARLKRSRRLKAIDAEETSKRKREEARNTLEAYLYRLRDLLSDEDATAPFVKCSQTSERKKLSEKVDETLVWLNDKGDDANTMEYIDKRSALE